MKKLILLLFTILAISVQAQNRTVTGVVTEAETGEPLAGASVVPVGGHGQGTSTDLDGRFTLQVPQNITKLRVSYVGMKTVDVDITPGLMNIALENAGTNLDEVMVVAYGTAKKSAYTGSASVVKADQIENTLVTDVTSALNGTVAGVQLQKYNGAPGIEPTIRIRGTGSINASMNPLYVVDGVPYDGNITSISPNDVESMTVLKDAAAAALYGARGANGVILITTKKGRDGNAVITVDMNWGANSRQVADYATVSSAQAYYQQIFNAIKNTRMLTYGASSATAAAYANNILSSSVPAPFGYQVFTLPAGQVLFTEDGQMNPNATLGYLYGGQYWLTPDDWKKETYANGFRQEYSLSIQGGSDRYDYMMSLNYLADDGVIAKSGFDRLSARMTGNYQVKKWLKVGANLSYTYENNKYPESQTSDGQSANAFYLANMMAPIYPFYARDAQGQIMRDEASGRPIYDYGMNGLGAPNLNRVFSVGNPTGSLVYDVSQYLYDTFDSKWYAQITPVEGLTITGTVGYWMMNLRNNDMANSQYGQMSQYGGYVYQETDRWRSINLQALANYRKSWGVNNFDFLLGYESYDWKTSYIWGQAYTLYNNDNYTLSNGIDQKDLGGGINSYATRGIFGRINYDYDGKYYASGSYRRDASSRFAPDKRWGNFFSLSAGWDISKENFMQDYTNVDMLKFKVSFGQQGNDNIGNYYAYMDQYNMTGSNGVWNASQLAYKGNPDLTWETSNSFNIGVDFSFFQGKLDGTVEYFQRQTSDMLYNRPVNPSLGYSSFPMNVGSMRNSGLEIELRATPVQTKDFQWDLNFNLTYVKNKILKLAPELNGEWINGSRIYREGHSMYDLYLVQYAGVDKETGLPLYWAMNPDGVEETTTNWNLAYQGNTSTGYKANRKVTGNMLPPVYGGFGTTLKFYGVDVSVQFGYQLGGKIWDYGYQNLMHNGTHNGFAMHVDALNAWTPENTNTDIPRLDYEWQYMYSSSDRWLISAKYLSLNNINIGYNFETKWIKKMGLTSLRIYGAADNVAIWSARKGLDPRQSYVQSYMASYSTLRTISGGVKFTF